MWSLYPLALRRGAKARGGTLSPLVQCPPRPGPQFSSCRVRSGAKKVRSLRGGGAYQPTQKPTPQPQWGGVVILASFGQTCAWAPKHPGGEGYNLPFKKKTAYIRMSDKGYGKTIQIPPKVAVRKQTKKAFRRTKKQTQKIAVQLGGVMQHFAPKSTPP